MWSTLLCFPADIMGIDFSPKLSFFILSAMMTERPVMPSNLIGFLAHNNVDPLCDGDSCVIMGSRGRMKRYAKRGNLSPITIQAADFASIADGIERGGAYSFDEQAFRRFLPLAQKVGFPIEDQDFTIPPPPGVAPDTIHLVRIQFFGWP